MKPQRIEARRRDAALFEAVLGCRSPTPARTRWRVHVVAWLLALAAHLGLLVVANRAEPSLETWSARMATLIHKELATQTPVVIEEPPPPEPEPEPVASPAPPRPAERPPHPAVREKARPEASRNQSSEPEGQSAPPAEAGRIVEAEAEASGPVDFTDNAFVTGTASAYVGGASARDGTNRTPVPEGAVDRNARPTANPGRPSRARSVQLSAREWQCDWPKAAVAQDIYEQFVVLRVVVRADGTVERATVVSDPGHGFGEAAVACARRTRFSPAWNADGDAIRAASPPIRVRFTR